MVSVVQWLEHWIVVPVVGGSSPLAHPITQADFRIFDQVDFI